MEEEVKEEKKTPRIHKIQIGDKVKVWANEWQGKKYYSVMVNQKQYDGTIKTWYKPVTFQKGVDLENGTQIIIKYMFENLRENPKDRYNPISSYMIWEFEEVRNERDNIQQALNEYDQDIEITDDMLPF